LLRFVQLPNHYSQKFCKQAGFDADAWLGEAAGWLVIKAAKLLRGNGVPTSLKNVQPGNLVIVKNNKAKLNPAWKEVGDVENEGERVLFTAVKTVAQLCSLDFTKHTVLVWHQNFRLTDDFGFKKPQKKAPAGKHYNRASKKK
jgi:hypothetical protein